MDGIIGLTAGGVETLYNSGRKPTWFDPVFKDNPKCGGIIKDIESFGLTFEKADQLIHVPSDLNDSEIDLVRVFHILSGIISYPSPVDVICSYYALALYIDHSKNLYVFDSSCVPYGGHEKLVLELKSGWFKSHSPKEFFGLLKIEETAEGFEKEYGQSYDSLEKNLSSCLKRWQLT